MSGWRERRSLEKPGRVEMSTFPFAELFLPLVLLLGMLAMLGPGGAMLLMGSGFALFLVAKLSVFRRGIYVSWGSRAMSAPFRACYRLGYSLILLGAVAVIFSAVLRAR